MSDNSDDFDVVGRITVDDEGTSSIESLNQGLDTLQGKSEDTGGSFLDMGNIADFALGGLLSSAVEGAIGAVGDLASGFVDLAGQGIDLAVGALQDFIGYLGDAVDEAAGMQDTTAIIGATIKNLGSTTDETVSSMSDLADSIGQTTTMSHDQALAAEKTALSYANLSSKVMPDYMTALTNMAAGTGRSASSLGMIMSRALADPGKIGVTALRRYGVILTQTQTDAIKALQKSGDLAGAQELLLSDIETKFGGDAAAAAGTYNGQMSILHDTFSQLTETVGNALLPALTTIVSTFHDLASNPQVTEFFQGLGAAVANIVVQVAQWIKAFVGGGGLQSAMEWINVAFGKVINFTADFGNLLVSKIIPTIVKLAQTWIPILIAWFGKVSAWAVTEGPKIWAFFIGLIAWVQKVLPGVEKFAGGIIKGVQSAIAWVQKILPVVEPVIGKIINGIKSVISFITGGGIQKAAGGLLGGLFGGAGGEANAGGALKTSIGNIMSVIQNVVTFIKQNGPQIMAIVQKTMAVVIPQLIKLAVEVVPKVTDMLKQLSAWFVENGPKIVKIVSEIATVIQTLAPYVVSVVETILPVIQDLLTAFMAVGGYILDIFTGNWVDANKKLQAVGIDMLQGAVDLAKAIVDAFFGLITSILSIFHTSIPQCLAAWKNVFGDLVNWMRNFAANVVGGFLSGLTNAWKGVTTWLSNAVANVEKAFRDALGVHSDSTVFNEIGQNLMSGLANGIKKGLTMPVTAIMQAAPALTGAMTSGNMGVGGSIGKQSQVIFNITGGDPTAIARQIVTTLKLQGIQIIQ